MSVQQGSRSAPNLLAEALRMRQELEQERIRGLASALGTEGLAWLAVVPTWTQRFASDAEFPTGGLSLDAWLTQAEADGLVEREPVQRADLETGREFWISEADRPLVLEFLRSSPSFGPAGLRRTAATAAQRLQRNTGGDASRTESNSVSGRLPEALDRWAHLAADAEHPAEVARQFGREVDQLTRDSRLGEARATVAAGTTLARALGGPLDSAVDLGTRRIELAYRQAGDARHLRRYFRRAEQEQAFDDLLESSGPAWALHYLGMGGVGKTMLLRRITAQIAKAREIPVSRIDFDHISPDYPLRRPGQLLLALAAELRPYAQRGGERLLEYLVNATQDLHELLGAEPPADDPLVNVRRPEFDRLLQIFVDLVGGLGPRVVLLLDTCEELARITVVNRLLPAVEATFEILSRVHEAVPSLRAVFAGRRPLATSGDGWALRSRAADAAAAFDPSEGLRPFLPPRAFLRLHEIRGLTGDEARQFLADASGLSTESGGERERAVLQRSRESGRVAEIIEARTRSLPDEPRYNPFDLALYGEWLRDEPALEARTILDSDSDPYVDVRIVQRIHEPAVRDALPSIAALGRVDADTLAVMLPADASPERVDEVYRTLADYEWTDQQRDADSGRLYLEVDRHLLPRVRKYYEHPERSALAAAARRRLSPYLERLARGSRLAQQGVHQVDAALALLPPPDAARLWADILVRVPDEADWSWLRNVLERVIAAEGALSRQPSLGAGLALAATSLQLQLSHVDAAAEAPRPAAVPWPDPVSAPWLQRLTGIADCTRALRLAASTSSIRDASSRLAQLVRTFSAVEGRGDDAAGDFDRRRSEEDAAALLCAGEALVDFWADSPLLGTETGAPVAELLVALADVVGAHEYPASLLAMAEMTAARAAACAGSGDVAEELMRRALETVTAAEPESLGRRAWLLWQQPESVIDRVRLEALLLHRDHFVGGALDAGDWLGRASSPSRALTIDGDRLASAVEQWALDHALPDLTDLDASEVADTYDPERQPTARAHRVVPPLFVTLARRRMAFGDFAGADEGLRARVREAERTRRDPETVRLGTVARVDLARRTRVVPDDLPAAARGLGRARRDRADARPVRAVEVLTGVRLANESARSKVTDRETHDAVPLDDVLEIVESERVAGTVSPGVRGLAVGSVDSLLRGMLRLYALDPIPPEQLGDAVVVQAFLAPYLPFSLRYAAAPGTPPPSPSAPRRVERARLVTMVATWNRSGEEEARDGAGASAKPDGPAEDMARHLLDHVGRRRIAALALEIGELMALRLPAAGERLLVLAAQLAVAARDSVTTIQAGVTGQLAAARAGRQWTAAATGLDALVHRAWVESPPGLVPPWATVASARALVDGTQVPQAVADTFWQGWVCRAAVALALGGGDRPGAMAVLQGFPQQAGSPELAFTGPVAEPSIMASADAPLSSPSRESAPRSTVWPAVVAVLGSTAYFLFLVGSAQLIIPTRSIHDDGSTSGSWWSLAWLGAYVAVVALIGWLWRGLRDIAVGFVVLVLISSIGYAVLGWLGDLVLPWVLGPWQRLIALAALVTTAASVPGGARAAWRAWRARIAARSLAIGEIRTPRAWGLQDVPKNEAVLNFSLLRVSARSPFGVPELRDERPWSTRLELPSLARLSYADIAMLVDEGAMLPFAQVRRELAGRTWPVALACDGVAPAPWEAILTGAVLRASQDASENAAAPVDEPVFFYRSTAGPSWPAPWEIGSFSVIGNAAGGALDSSDQWRASGWAFRADASSADLVHAVGTPVLTNSGPRLRLDEDAVSLTVQLESVAAANSASAGLLDGTTLRSGLPLLVLQQVPAEASGRLPSDREQAAALRAVAADLFETGIGAVLVVPSLPPELANTVVGEIVRALTPRRSRWARLAGASHFDRSAFWALARAVLAARRTILASDKDTWLGDGEKRAGASFADPRQEAAWDVCLMTRFDPRDSSGSLADAGARPMA